VQQVLEKPQEAVEVSVEVILSAFCCAVERRAEHSCELQVAVQGAAGAGEVTGGSGGEYGDAVLIKAIVQQTSEL
jgi:hypothetical protein